MAVSGKTASKCLKDLKVGSKHVSVSCGSTCGLDFTVFYGEPVWEMYVEHLFTSSG